MLCLSADLLLSKSDLNTITCCLCTICSQWEAFSYGSSLLLCKVPSVRSSIGSRWPGVTWLGDRVDQTAPPYLYHCPASWLECHIRPTTKARSVPPSLPVLDSFAGGFNYHQWFVFAMFSYNLPSYICLYWPFSAIHVLCLTGVCSVRPPENLSMMASYSGLRYMNLNFECSQKSGSRTIHMSFYTPRNEVRGVYWIHPVCLSVSLSVCLPVCPLTFRVRPVASTVQDGFFPYFF